MLSERKVARHLADKSAPSHIGAVPAFIRPSEAIEQATPPAHEAGWFHEVLFDGDRLQIHKRGKRAIVFSKTGKDVTARYRDLADAVAALSCASCVIDAVGVGPDSPSVAGSPNLTRVAWCFDLLERDGQDMRGLPLLFRHAALASLLRDGGSALLRVSETFSEAAGLLAAACERGLTGIVSKEGLQPYVSGRNPGWVKVRCGGRGAASAKVSS